MTKKILWGLALLFVLFMIYESPAGMGHLVHNLIGGAMSLADRFSIFISNL
jgi:hypothetical protein